MIRQNRLFAVLILVLCFALTGLTQEKQAPLTVLIDDFDHATGLATRWEPSHDQVAPSFSLVQAKSGLRSLKIVAHLTPDGPPTLTLTHRCNLPALDKLAFWYFPVNDALLHLQATDGRTTVDWDITREDVTLEQWNRVELDLTQAHVAGSDPPRQARLNRLRRLTLLIRTTDYPEPGDYTFFFDDFATIGPADPALRRLYSDYFIPLDDCESADQWSALLVDKEGKVADKPPDAGIAAVTDEPRDGAACLKLDFKLNRKRGALLAARRSGLNLPLAPYLSFWLQAPDVPYLYARVEDRDGTAIEWNVTKSHLRRAGWNYVELNLERGRVFDADPKRSNGLLDNVNAILLGVSESSPRLAKQGPVSYRVDDLNLASGRVAPLAAPRGKLRGRLAIDRTAYEDDDAVSALVLLPTPPEQAERVRFVLRRDSATLATRDRDLTLRDDGTATATYAWKTGDHPNGPYQLSAEVMTLGGRTLASAAVSFTKRGTKQIVAQLASVEKRLGEFVQSIEAREIHGERFAYQRSAAQVIRSFVEFGREDLRRENRRRAEDIATYLEELVSRATDEMDRGAARGLNLETLPHYDATNLAVRDGNFFAGDEPIFLSGACGSRKLVDDLPLLSEYGLSLATLQLTPAEVLPRDGPPRQAPLDTLLKTLDAARQGNVAVSLALSPESLPTWARDKWPELKQCGYGRLNYCLESPYGRQVLQQYLEFVIPQVAGHAALRSYIIGDQPLYRGTCSYTRRLWTEYLQRRHGTLEALNATWGTNLTDWTQAPFPQAKQAAAWYDWCAFNQWRLAEFYRWVKQMVRNAGGTQPVHVRLSPAIFDRRMVHLAPNPEDFAQFCELNGCACSFPRGPWKEYSAAWRTPEMFYDLLRSLAPDRPVFNSENRLIRDRDWRSYPESHVRTGLWLQALHGQGAQTVWVWDRSEARRSLVRNILTRPRCTYALCRTSLDLRRLAGDMAALNSAPGEVALLYAIPSIVHNPQYLTCLSEAYEALAFTGRPLRFLSERQILAADSLPYRLIIVPQATHVYDTTVAGLRTFVEQGGTLLLLGDNCLAATPYVQSRGTPPPDADKLPWTADTKAKTLWPELLKRVAAVCTPPALSLAGPKGEPVWGVEWRAVARGEELLLTAVNLTRSPAMVQVLLGGQQISAKDLLTGERYEGPFELPPMQPVLVRVKV